MQQKQPPRNTPIIEFRNEGLVHCFHKMAKVTQGMSSHTDTCRSMYIEPQCVVLPDGQFHWQSAWFPYWALNMKQLLSKSKVYIQQHPCGANLNDNHNVFIQL